MRKSFKYLFLFLMFFSTSLLIVGCSSKKNDNNNNNSNQNGQTDVETEKHILSHGKIMMIQFWKLIRMLKREKLHYMME